MADTKKPLLTLYVDPLGRARTLANVRVRGRAIVGRIVESEVRGERGMAFIGAASGYAPTRGPRLPWITGRRQP